MWRLLSKVPQQTIPANDYNTTLHMCLHYDYVILSKSIFEVLQAIQRLYSSPKLELAKEREIFFLNEYVFHFQERVHCVLLNHHIVHDLPIVGHLCSEKANHIF